MQGFFTIDKIREMAVDGILNQNDVVDLSSYNANLFCYTMIKLPFKRLSPMQELIFDTFYNPANHFKELELICGRKSGKSLLSSSLLLYEVFKKLTLIKDPHEYYGIPRKKSIYFQLLASNRDQAQDINFDYIKSLATTSPYLNRMIVNSTNDEIQFEKKLVVKVYNSSARSVRGESSAVILYDEIAHWIDNRGNLSGDEIYYAAQPNLKVMKHEGQPAEGRSVLLTSPAGRQGIAWELFRYGKAISVLEHTMEHGEEPWRCVFQAPTWVMNPKFEFNCIGCDHEGDDCHFCASGELHIDWKKNKDKFAQEYGAEFCDTVNPAVNKEQIMACIDETIVCNPLLEEKEIPRVIVIDAALSGNAYALTMQHMNDYNTVVVDLVKLWQGNRDCPIKLRTVEDFIVKLYENFYITHVVADQFQSASTVQSLQDRGIPSFLVPTTTKNNMDTYDRLLKRINAMDRRKEPPYRDTILYPNHKTLLNEFMFLQRKVSGRTVRYEASINSSDDITDCLAKGVMVLETEGRKRFFVEKIK